MIAIALTALLAPLVCSDVEYDTREAAQAMLSAFGDWSVTTRILATTQDAEQRHRLRAVRACLTIRDVDLILSDAKERYPRPVFEEAHPDARFMKYRGVQWPFAEESAPENWPPEFVADSGRWDYFRDASFCVVFIIPTTAEQAERTRAGLITYAGRTGDFQTIKNIVEDYYQCLPKLRKNR